MIENHAIMIMGSPFLLYFVFYMCWMLELPYAKPLLQQCLRCYRGIHLQCMSQDEKLTYHIEGILCSKCCTYTDDETQTFK